MVMIIKILEEEEQTIKSVLSACLTASCPRREAPLRSSFISTFNACIETDHKKNQQQKITKIAKRKLRGKGEKLTADSWLHHI
jgi:hypothetical protein